MKLIENDFPIEKVNIIADAEGRGGTSKPIFEPLMYLHKWWARRFGSIFRTIVLYSLLDEGAQIIEEDDSRRKVTEEEIENPWLLYLKDFDFEGKIILDPFMGAGISIIEGLRANCKVIGQDLNPVAWLMVKNAINSIDCELLQQFYEDLEEYIAEEVLRYNKTVCPECLNLYIKSVGKSKSKILEEINNKLEKIEDPNDLYDQYSFVDKSKINTNRNIFASSMYYFWVKQLNCLSCGKNVSLFRDYRVANDKKGKKTLGYYIICPECWELFYNKSYPNKIKCPKCEYEFNPKSGPKQKVNFVCTNKDCGQKLKIINVIRRSGKPNLKMFAIEYYCPYCKKKGYKKVDDFDYLLFEKAKEEYKSREKDLLGRYIPNSIIESEKNPTQKSLTNHGYKEWKDLFNERQLLNIAKVLKAIQTLNAAPDIKELFYLTFSTALNYNNMLCDYHPDRQYIGHLFRIHGYPTTEAPVENNFWGAERGMGTFSNFINKTIKYKQYNDNPFEKYVVESGDNEKKFMKIKVIGNNGDIFKESNKNAMIMCGDSSYIPVPPKSVDAVITDPPYYGNVLYSELSDFFYVWLRLVLIEKYDYFRSKYSPKITEIVVKKAGGEWDKTEEDYIEGLTEVFRECERKLKDEGVMVFTFHHQKEEAWAAVLKSVLDANFYITSIYPVQSEMATSDHIAGKVSISYDMIVVCKKRVETSEKKIWSRLEDILYTRVEEEIDRLEKKHINLSSEDIFVITIGKCLELYSKYYPNVYKGGKELSIDDALASIREIVDEQLMPQLFNQVEYETDLMTAIYLIYLANKTNLSYNALNKLLKMRSISINQIKNSGLINIEGDTVFINTPRERVEKLETKKLGKLSAIDIVHFLYHQWTEGTITDFESSLSVKERKEWASEQVITTLKYLIEAENDKVYKDLLDYLEKKWLIALSEEKHKKKTKQLHF